MGTKNVNKLHNDHIKWNYAVDQWILEIDSLLKDLEEFHLSNPVEKTKKYQNHLKHNKRFLKEMQEVIQSHELFLNEFTDMDMSDVNIEMDHYKTEDHIKEFKKRFDKLKVKINKLLKSDS